jgi:NRPS condensation-like uncharacterized protein
MSNEPSRLRLHSVEHFMLADSRASHPMTFFLRVELADGLDIERLRTAAGLSLRMHPLLAATIRRRRGAWGWNLSPPSAEQLPAVTQHTAGEYFQSRSDWSFDLTRQSGLRISLAENELWLQVHHSCCDARGLLDFLGDLQSQYISPHSPAAVETRVTKAIEHFPQRAIGFSPRVTSYLNLRSPKWSRIVGYFWHRSRPLASSENRDGLGDRGEFAPTYVQRELPLQSAFSPEGIVSERQQATQHTATRSLPPTLNDWLLQAMFAAMAEHQTRIAPSSGTAWLRIGMPIDMRQPGERLASACNASSLVFIDRRVRQILDPNSDWAASVSRETQHIKRERLGVVFFDCLEVAHRLPLGMPLAVADRRCAVTSVVSNLGRLQFSKNAPFAIERIDFLPPLRPGTRLALGAATLDNRLSLTLHYDARHIAAGVATKLLNSVVERVAQCLAARLISCSILVLCSYAI